MAAEFLPLSCKVDRRGRLNSGGETRSAWLRDGLQPFEISVSYERVTGSDLFRCDSNAQKAMPAGSAKSQLQSGRLTFIGFENAPGFSMFAKSQWNAKYECNKYDNRCVLSAPRSISKLRILYG